MDKTNIIPTTSVFMFAFFNILAFCYTGSEVCYLDIAAANKEDYEIITARNIEE